MMPGRYLLALNLFQKTCLAGGGDERPYEYYMQKLAEYIRRNFIRVYMYEPDYRSAIDYLYDPYIREHLEKFPDLLRDTHYVLSNVRQYKKSRDLVDRARCYSSLLGADALRLAAALALAIDGIVSFEPADFIQRAEDKEAIISGRGDIFVEENQNIEGFEDVITVFVATPYSFLLEIDDHVNVLSQDNADLEQQRIEGEVNKSSKLEQICVEDWNLLTGKSGVKSVSVSLRSKDGRVAHKNVVGSDFGEIDSLLAVINECANELIQLPSFHLSYTVNSAQGIPSPVQVEIGLSFFNRLLTGSCRGDSTNECTINAYMQALNKVLVYSGNVVTE